MPKLMTLRRLSSLFRSAIEPAAVESYESARDATLKHFVGSLDTSPSSSSPPSPSPRKRLSLKLSPSKPKPKKKPPPTSSSSSSSTSTSTSPSPSPSPRALRSILTEDSEDARLVSREISSILPGIDASVGSSSDASVNDLTIPWFQNLTNETISLRRRDCRRDRKQSWVFNSGQFNRFNRLVGTCSTKFGTDNTLLVFGKLGRETGVKELNAMMKICMKEARRSGDEDAAVGHLSKAFQILLEIRERGFPIEEHTYGPFLSCLIDMGLVQDFQSSADIIKDANPSALARLGYYEMRLHIRVNDEEKVQELCNYICTDHGDENFDLQKNYLLALCEGDREDDLLKLLDIVDVTKISSVEHLSIIFKSLGRLLLESAARKFLLMLQECDNEADDISTLIFSYASSIPNLTVEDVVSKFESLHQELEIAPSSKSYEQLVVHICHLHKVHEALDVVDQMCEAGLSISIDTIDSILCATEESSEFNLVRRIYSLICQQHLQPNNETLRSMIILFVKMKDFEGAYGMLNDLKKLNLKPNASMYNAILGGYYREKNVSGAMMVLKQMKLADVKPDSITYSYLIANCNSEQQLVQYYEEMKVAGVQVSKQVFMSIINAYAACGQFQKATEVLLEKEIPIKNLSEIKSVLVSALASHGQISDALKIYDEIKEAGSNPEPKAVISLIEHLQSEGELSTLLKLLEDLEDHGYWVDGCRRVVLFCIRNKHLKSAMDLLKELTNTFSNDELAMDVLFDEVFSVIPETEPIDVQMGLDLLQLIKDEIGVYPSRKCLDFLLSACVKAKDLRSSLLVWKEYQAAGLPYNVTSYLRMYQALLASKAHVSAKVLLNKIPKDDPHVRIVIQACRESYGTSASGSEGQKKMKKKGRKE